MESEEATTTNLTIAETSPWLEAATRFVNQLQTLADFLDNYHSKAIKRLGIYRYPMDNYVRGWRDLCRRVEQSVNKHKENSESQLVISTGLFWVMPQLATSYNDIFIFSKQFCSSSQAVGIDPQEIEAVYEEFRFREKYQIQQVKIEYILKLPFYFMERFMEHVFELGSCLEEELRRGSIEASESVEQKVLQKVRLVGIELRQIQEAVKQLNDIIEFLSRDEEGLNRDNSVIKYNLVLKQYPQIEKELKQPIKHIYRLKMFLRWKQLQVKRAKRQKERKMNILQLIDGEDKYIAGLDEYIAGVKDPIEKQDLLSNQQRRKLFSSILEIKEFHISMAKQLRGMFENYSESQQYGPVLKKFLPFFKLYTDYILNADQAQKFLQQLIRKEPVVASICAEYTKQAKKVAENELLQPTFRIARYQMLFSEIIKKTSEQHPDKILLTEVLHAFKKILTEVNSEVDKIIRRNRLNQLEQEYGTAQKPIYAQGRQFLCEHNLILIREPRPQQVSLIIFNDLLLIVEEMSRKLIRSIVVNSQFFARRQQDNKIYRNMITVHSDGFTTFTTGPEEVNAPRANQIYQILKKITKDSGQLVYISVLGTQEIGSTSFAKYTEYIIEVKYLDLKKLLHLRFSTVLGVVKEMQEYYQSSLKITEEESLKKNWFNSHKSKTIEARKLIIMQIFQKMFNHELIKKDPDHFLRYLNLPPNFYQIARHSYEKRLTMGQSVSVSGLKRSYLTKREEKEAFTILCGTEIKLGRDLFHDFDNEEERRKLKDLAEKIEIEVMLLSQQEPIRVLITEYDTVEDVCNKVSKLIGLRSNRDFRLFHEIGKKELRVLDHEQLITKIFQFPKNENRPIVGVFETMKSTLTKMISPETLPTLIFKKYYYLPYEVELSEVRRDLTRLRLVVYQVFAEVQEMKYQLNFDEYLLFVAMATYISIDGKLQALGGVDPDSVHRIIPEVVFKLKNYSEEEWLQKSKHHVERIHQQIGKVIDYNRDQMQRNKIKVDSVSKNSLYFGRKHLCSQIVLNKIKNNPIFGSNIFYVSPHSSCYKKLEERGVKMAYNMWLAVKVQSVNLLTPSSKESVLQLKYTDIGKVDVFSEAVVFITDGAIQEQYRLNTYQSFQISQLVKYNKALNEILTSLKQEPDLNSRVKMYREQLLQYRSTHDQADDGPSMSMVK